VCVILHALSNVRILYPEAIMPVRTIIEPLNNRPLEGQVAMVTGAGRRLGGFIALALARAGANLVVHYNESKEGAQASVREIERLGGQAIAVRADVSRPKQVAAMFRVVEKRLGRLDVLVNNAGVFFPAKWDQLSEADWDKVLGTNLKGAFFCAQAAARLMRRQGHGRIVIISSVGGLQAWPDYIHYCASKAGVISLTRSLAKALAPHIQVNSVAPGTIVFPDERRDARLERIISGTPLRKAGRPEDIADMVLFLATRSDFITGQVFVVDGGKSIP
jgi:NAD(P)-dependent dehydrogenase (short-subunit alcohol dehydrogenase family)